MPRKICWLRTFCSVVGSAARSKEVRFELFELNRNKKMKVISVLIALQHFFISIVISPFHSAINSALQCGDTVEANSRNVIADCVV